MLRKTITIFAVALLTALALSQDKLTVKELRANVKKFDTKEISVSGRVENFKQKTSRTGNDYFTFLLVDKVDRTKAIHVYGRGKALKPLLTKDLVLVTGTFRTEKKVGDMTFKNEIQVVPAQIVLLARPK